MVWRVWILSIGGLVGGLASPSSQAVDFHRSTLEEVVRASDGVARVKISEVSNASIVVDGEPRQCGAVFTASIVEALKGPQGTFSFLASSRRDFNLFGKQVDYLVFVLNVRDQLSKLELSRQDLRDLRCRIEPAPYVLREDEQGMIPILRRGTADGDDERLAVTRTSPLSNLPGVDRERTAGYWREISWQAARDRIAEFSSLDRPPRCAAGFRTCSIFPSPVRHEYVRWVGNYESITITEPALFAEGSVKMGHPRFWARFCSVETGYRCFSTGTLDFAVPRGEFEVDRWTVHDVTFEVVQRDVSITIFGRRHDDSMLIRAADYSNLDTLDGWEFLYSRRNGLMAIRVHGTSATWWLVGETGFGAHRDGQQ